MAMTASSGVAQGAGRCRSGRALAFLRTTELLAPYQPAKPLITLSLGEPQHPVPDFVGPVLAKHIADFGRYPLAKGIEPFRRAAANWLTTRFELAAAGRSRDRNPGAERQPRRAVFRGDHRRPLCRPAQGQAGDPDAQPVLSGLWRGRPRRRLRTDLPADHARQRIFARSRCARRRDAGADRRDVHRLARQSARRRRLARLSSSA